MRKLGALLLFIGVAIAHILALGSITHTPPKKTVSKKADITKITLSSVTIKKPVVIPPKPPKKVIKPKPKPKPIIKKSKKKKILKKRKKRVKKKVVKRVKPKIEEEIQPEPIVEEEPQIEPTPPPQRAVAKVDTASIKAIYTNKIRQSIQHNLIYPKIAKRLRHQGIVKVSFRVKKSGKIRDIKVINSPKSSLSRGAIKTIKAIKAEPIPKELNIENLDITIPIEFKIK